jgi:8-oxo-dGTP diphosphatase
MEQERPKIGIGVIVIRNGKVLLGERLASHGAGTWAIPGGHLEFNETFEETAKREVQEETGLTNIKVRGLVSIMNDRVYDRHFVSIGILAESVSGEPYAAEPEKSANWAWFAVDALPDNIFIPSKGVLDNWLAGRIYTQGEQDSSG